MTKPTNLVGKTFGHLKVIARAEKDSSKRNCYLCKCVCGNEKIIRGSSLSYGLTIACGCMYDLNMSLIPYYGA